jgi:K+-sensing histidine kinase KdpD
MLKEGQKHAGNGTTREQVSFMKIMKALEKIATAVAFAEAGEWNSALDIMHAEKTSKKILIAYEGEPDNRRIIEYAIGIAERVKCDMLFSYVATKKKAENLTQDYIEMVNKTFNEAFEREVEALQMNGKNINFQHVVVSSEFYEAVNSICREVKKIEFVILGCSERNAARLRLNVPYFFFK